MVYLFEMKYQRDREGKMIKMNLTEEEIKKVEAYVLQQLDNPTADTEPDAEMQGLCEQYEDYVYQNVQKGNYEMNYQLKHDSKKSAKSAEALFRMKNPYDEQKRRILNPEVVFTLLKKQGHEKQVVLSQVERVMKDLRENNVVNADPSFKVSVNVALDCIDKDLVTALVVNGGKYAVQPSNIEIEILETENFDKIPEHQETIDTLKRMGVKFALDDFGSRNAKDVDVLKKLQFDEVKLDKGLLDEAKESGDYSKIQQYYDAVSENLPEASVVMEGVDGIYSKEKGDYTLKTEEVVAKLKEIGKMKYQGYGYTKPKNPADFGSAVAEFNHYSAPTLGA